MLELREAVAGYGDSTVLRGVSIEVSAGQAVSVVGPNGAGKTTLIRTICGLLPVRSGARIIDGVDATAQSVHAIARAGVCHIPEGRGVFPGLSVRDNMMLFAGSDGKRTAVERGLSAFPQLTKHLNQRAGSLSGGQQQMLALSRVVVSNPSVVLIDEASLGLAPVIVDEIYDFLGRIVSEGIGVLVVEQYVTHALRFASHVYVLQRGALVYSGAPNELGSQEQLFERYLEGDLEQSRST
ncbi:ABC transporter ATP-binding protein [Jatrophihabitans sp.]|uniref:ABC transporter ATP-binding protein n=1 Tax=Jatrophihabitans sp. TaxID=1932789 RepID=UPI0030C725B0|nr:branched-chain amino acid transporter, permease component [Jatrophihabitans sp.]